MSRSQSLLMALVCAFALAFPPQVHEIYRSMAEAFAIGMPNAWFEPLASSITLILLCWGTFMLGETYGPTAVSVSAWGRPASVATAHLPMIGAAVGIYWARIDPDAVGSLRSALMQARQNYLVLDGAGTADQVRPIAERFATNIMQFNDYLLYASLAVGAAALLLGMILLLIISRRSPSASRGRRPAYLAAAAIAATVVMIAITAASGSRVATARALMPVPMLAIALFLACFWLSWLGSISRTRRIPVIIGIVVAAILFSAFDLNDDHRVRSLEAKATSPRTNVGAEFKTWLKSRTDLAAYSGKKYPIYLIAAQGGGIYAAYHAASFLASVQDDCPKFGNHIFAISGVSGGSVGSSVFASLIHQASAASVANLIGDLPCRKDNSTPPTFQDATTELLSADYLTPLLGSFLFADAFQQILFFPVGPFDRARSLELGLEQSWTKVIGSKQFISLRGGKQDFSHPLSSSFTSLWQPGRSPAPALVLNTTEVTTGRRRVVSPFEFDGIDVSFLPIWSNTELARQYSASVPNIPVSAAAFLSSRFPWVTPAGFFEDLPPNAKKPVKVRVVDGGYFENSGLATALDLLSSLEAAVDGDPELKPFSKQIEFNIITLNSKRFDLGSFTGFGEWLAPISTMMSTRSARAPLETSRAELLVERSMNSSVSVTKRMFRFDLDGLGYPLPLGWRLSAVTRLLISNQLGTRSRCAAPAPAGGDVSSDCLKKAIAEQLGAE